MYFEEVKKNFGFGCMRLPMMENGTDVDIAETTKMVDTFLEQGFNYFDTAHGYSMIFGSAILRSIGDSERPLYSLIVAGVVNTLLNLVLVIVFHMGVAGVAIATVISNMVSSGIVIFILMHETEPIRLDLKRLGINTHELKQILKIGIPAGLQGMFFSIANVCIQSSINSFGSSAIAGSAAVRCEDLDIRCCLQSLRFLVPVCCG